ncbi:DUF308 domain-containing protein [Odoribacter sp. OttesenSCG-928-J03]|nr:DUF308 domain-containing protein [Odoribacter sp. OttesenSCG-928-J03]MDL2330659.1 DUF308 domain-containing protein [Odoribacter sp. OttesenSCG-928-A06]
MRIVYSKSTFKNAVLRSLISIAAGIALIIWKDLALKSIVMFVGALFIISGLMSFIKLYRKIRQHEQGDSLQSFNGLGSILIGVLLLISPIFFVNVLMYIFGALFIIGAIAQFATFSAARQFGPVSGIAYIFPILILVAGILVFANPWGGATTVMMILGVMAIFYGVTDLISQYRINRLRKQFEESHGNDYIRTIEDADYEEVKEEEDE